MKVSCSKQVYRTSFGGYYGYQLCPWRKSAPSPLHQVHIDDESLDLLVPAVTLSRTWGLEGRFGDS